MDTKAKFKIAGPLLNNMFHLPEGYFITEIELVENFGYSLLNLEFYIHICKPGGSDVEVEIEPIYHRNEDGTITCNLNFPEAK
jgi:hypothetical protein